MTNSKAGCGGPGLLVSVGAFAPLLSCSEYFHVCDLREAVVVADGVDFLVYTVAIGPHVEYDARHALLVVRPDVVVAQSPRPGSDFGHFLHADGR